MVRRGATTLGDQPSVARPLDLEVTHPRGRSHQDPCAHELSSPAEVDVVPLLAHLGVEAVEGVEQVAADEQTGGGHREDVAHGIVLLLVELAPLDDRRDRARLVDVEPDREQALGRVPLDELRADDAGVRAERLLDEQAHGVGVRRHVAVQDREVGGALDRAEHLVGGRGEARVLGQPAHVGTRQRGGHAGGRVGRAGRVDHQHREAGVVLPTEARQGLLEPRPWVGDHDDRHDRWCAQRFSGVGIHVLAAESSPPVTQIGA